MYHGRCSTHVSTVAEVHRRLPRLLCRLVIGEVEEDVKNGINRGVGVDRVEEASDDVNSDVD